MPAGSARQKAVVLNRRESPVSEDEVLGSFIAMPQGYPRNRRGSTLSGKASFRAGGSPKFFLDQGFQRNGRTGAQVGNGFGGGNAADTR